MPFRDTARLRRRFKTDDDLELSGPKSTVMDLRKGLGEEETGTQLDLGLTMVTRPEELELEVPPKRERRTAILLAIGIAVALAAMAAAYVVTYGRDAASAVGGDCVYDSADAALAPGNSWMAVPCSAPDVPADRYRVLMRVERTDDPAVCAASLTSWNETTDREIVLDLGGEPIVLCATVNT